MTYMIYSSQVTTESSFVCDSKVYKHIDGVALDSPFGLTLAIVFPCHCEKIRLNECTLQFKPAVQRRIVDNIFVMFKSKEYLKFFVNYMYSKHKLIKFNFKNEELDVKITHKNKGFVSSTFCKITFAGVLNNNVSFIFETYKAALVHRCLFRSFKICVSMENLRCATAETYFHYCSNCPVNIIDQWTKRFQMDSMSLNLLYQQYLKRNCSLFLHFYEFENRFVQASVSKTLPKCYIKVIFQTKKQLTNLFKFKESIPFYLRSFIIKNFNVVIAILLAMAKLKVIIELKLVNI